MASFDIMPANGDFSDVYVGLPGEVEELDVEGPPFEVLCWEYAPGGVPREDLEAALSVLVGETEHEVDQHVHAGVKKFSDPFAFNIFLARITTSDRNAESFA